MMNDMETERCDCCGGTITEDEASVGWPLPRMLDGSLSDVEYICPSCYGDEAWCACGSLLPADEETDVCELCLDAVALEEDRHDDD